MYIRQLGTFFFSFRIYISNNNVGYKKASGEEQEDGRSLYSVELFAHFDTDCSTHPDHICSCINDDDDDGEDIEDVNDNVNEMYCCKMTFNKNPNDDDDKDKDYKKDKKKEDKKDKKRESSVIVIVIATREGDWRGRGRGRNWW